MRPLRLELEGFAAFRDRTEVDFDDVDLFALVGPTGAGKSSLIDAMCFALYGDVPRLRDRRRVEEAITLGALQASVRLDFELAGERYVATRVVRRRKGGLKTEARLERLEGGGDTDVLASGGREVPKAVETLLGLSFEQFTTCVVLPQGEFARFLHERPEERQNLLVKLLGLDVYERMGRRARELATEAESAAKLAEQRLADLAFATEEARADAAGRLQSVQALRSRIDAARPEILRLDREIATAAASAAEAGDFVRLLEKVAVPEDVVDRARRRTEAVEQSAIAEHAATAAEQEVARRADALAELPDLATLAAARASHGQLANVVTEREGAERALASASAEETTASVLLREAEQAGADALAALQELHARHLAHQVATTLVSGEPCPVCDQVVSVVPSRPAPAALSQAEEAAARAKQVLDAADRDHRRVVEAGAGVRARLETLAQQEQKLRQRVADHPDLAKVDALTEQATAAHAALEQSRRAEAETRRAAKEARAAVDKADDALSRYARAFDAQRDSLVALGPPAPGRTDLAADWQELAAWAGDQQPRQHERAEQASRQAETLADDRHTRVRVLVDEATALNAAPSMPAIDQLCEAVVDAESGARVRLERVEAALAESGRLAADAVRHRADADVARELGRLLASDQFERWLLEEALDSLVAGASTVLLELSAGQYSLTRDDRDFLVVDHRNADETRPARTLSGGETFQASLALAVALADHLGGLGTAGAARLEAIFLDEGFGTLDQESLDLVAAAIENLGTERRMVGVVTHVPQLAERVPVRYQVTRGVRSSRVERVVT